MSIGLKIICRECRTSVYVGTYNSCLVEEPEKVSAFLRKHLNHELKAISESNPFYYEQTEDDLCDEEGESLVFKTYNIIYERRD